MIERASLLLSASACALVLANPALAQQASQPSPATGSTARTENDTAPQAQGEEIVVTGVRASLVGALNVKRESVQIVDSVVSEDIGKLPDNNVIEALQRITGVQVTNRGSGEAQGISIRGLGDALTTQNGRNIFTASGRSFSLADIPANLVSRIDVYKTRSASQIESGIAGQIDVFTRRPFDFDGFAISGLARGIYLEQDESINPNLSALVSDRWETGIGEVGLLVSGSYWKNNFREQSITAGAMVPFVTENPPPATGFTPLQRVFPETGAWQPGTERGLPTEAGSTFRLRGVDTPYYLSRDAVFSPDVQGERERPAVSAALQWSPNSTSTYTAEFFWNRFEQTTMNSLFFSFVDWWQDLGPNPGSTFELFDGTNIIKSRTVGSVFGFQSGDYTKSRTDSFVYALNGRWETGDTGYVTADLSYQNSEFNTQFLAMRLNRVANEINVDFNERDGFPAYNFDDNSLLLDPAQWTVGEFYDNANRSRGSAFTAHLDTMQEFEQFFDGEIRFGVRYDDRKAMDSVRTQDAPALTRAGVTPTAPRIPVRFNELTPDLQQTNSDFFQGRANVPTSWLVPNGQFIYDNTDLVRELYRSSVDPGILLTDALTMVDVFDINEKNMAAYLQLDTEIDLFGAPMLVQGGVRYVKVDRDLTFTDRVTGIVTDAEASTDAVLPSLTLRWDITPELRVRFNYGETLRQPAFGELNPFPQLVGDLTGIGRGSGTSGNANLQPTTSKNYDIGIEYYFNRSTGIFGTLFRREIDGLVVPFTSVLTIPGTGLNTNVFAVTRPENASNGVLEGAELGFILFPELPGVLNGLGAQGSLTILDSNQNIPLTDSAGNVVGEDESSFFGVSDLSYNVTLAYDRGPVGARLSYVWREAFLSNNEARLFANPIGVWRRPESSLDFQLTVAVTDELGVTFDAVNLTQELQQSYYKFEDAGGQDTHNLGTTLLPRTFALGVRYTFD
ncbi:TonB-dependent receptor [Croceibacterium sp. TMG7-5b_MA50]|uniref:TonB-dependent receptor n=1 Tax=Croceibacterium sp. TMG7-5b_MA50 TaxID=3121290 RepID=UPI003222035A